jgi:hypothetical protein
MRQLGRPLFEALESRQLMTVISVSNTNDSGTGSLRAAIAAASPGDTISLASLTGTISLQSSLTVGESLTINGPTSGTLTLDGNDDVRIFDLNASSSASVSMTNLTFADGSASRYGGAIYAESNSALTVTDCTFDNNMASASGNSVSTFGGAISAFNSLTVSNSTFTSNTVTTQVTTESSGYSYGGAIYAGGTTSIADSTFADNVSTATRTMAGDSGGSGGAIDLDGSATVTNCTFTGNSAVLSGGIGTDTSQGGAIGILESATITNCTITNNTAGTTGGGVWVFFDGGSGIFQNDIIAGNTGTGGSADLENNGSASGGHNLIGSSAGNSFVNGTDGNLVGSSSTPLAADVNALASNGGPTQTISLQSNSPAVNAGNDSTAPSTDQRGYFRSGVSDIGAYEFNGTLIASSPLTITSSTSLATTHGLTAGATVVAAGGTAGLTYTWTATHLPPGAGQPTYSTNGTNLSGNMVARFSKDGTYVLRCTVKDQSGNTAVADVPFIVSQTSTTLKISPHLALVARNTTRQFTTIIEDQFGHGMRAPQSISYAVELGSGTISSTGLFAAGATAGKFDIEAESNDLSGTTAGKVT